MFVHTSFTHYFQCPGMRRHPGRSRKLPIIQMQSPIFIALDSYLLMKWMFHEFNYVFSIASAWLHIIFRSSSIQQQVLSLTREILSVSCEAFYCQDELRWIKLWEFTGVAINHYARLHRMEYFGEIRLLRCRSWGLDSVSVNTTAQKIPTRGQL